jgi:phosphoribosylanthranilate isomerase
MNNRNPIKIKVCGMRDEENIREVGLLHPDFMGFIFYKDSPRYVGTYFQIPSSLPSSVKRVGVFVNESIESVFEIIKKLQLDFAQLHGDESLEYCQKLKDDGIRIIKVFRVNEEFDFSITSEFSGVADYFLFDTKGKSYGGNAKKFNWDLLSKYNNQTPFFLSGGIDPESMGEILQMKDLNLYAIDVNSGVESSPGVKDVSKVSAIIKSLRYEV